MREEIKYMRMAVMNTSGKEQEKCIRILGMLERRYKAVRVLNAILKGITYIAGALFFLGATTLDSDSYIPYIVTVISTLWIAGYMLFKKIYV